MSCLQYEKLMIAAEFQKLGETLKVKVIEKEPDGKPLNVTKEEITFVDHMKTVMNVVETENSNLYTKRTRITRHICQSLPT